MHLVLQPVEHYNCKQYTGLSAFLPRWLWLNAALFPALLQSVRPESTSLRKEFRAQNVPLSQHLKLGTLSKSLWEVSLQQEILTIHSSMEDLGWGEYHRKSTKLSWLEYSGSVMTWTHHTVLIIETCTLLILLLPQWSASSHTMRLIVYREAHGRPTVTFSLLLSLH